MTTLTLKSFPADRFHKTETGRQEVRARVHALSRSARNLLLILDGSKPATEWLTMVQGSTAADLQDLVEARLVEPVMVGEVPMAQAAEPEARAAAPAARPPGPTTGLSYPELYAALNAMVREQLGLIKGYRFTLDVEKASGLPELEDVALRFVEEVQKANGDAAARQVRRALRISY
jgi:hypothetical protein